MNRFYKFVTDTCVLDHTKQKSPTDNEIYSNDSVIFHSVNFSPNFLSASSYPSWTYNSVCMIQILNRAAAQTTSGVNTLVIYLTHLMLFDMDMSDVTAIYPINSPKVNAYALNSLPFYIGQGALSDAGVNAATYWLNYPWYKTDYVSYGPINLSSGTDYTLINNHRMTYGAPINYSSISSNNVTNGFNIALSKSVISVSASNFPSRSISKLFVGSSLWINLSTETTTWTAAFTKYIIFQHFVQF